MFPLRDSHPTKKFPLMLWIIIFLNIFVFFLEIFLPQEVFLDKLVLVPAQVDFFSLETLYPFLTSQFVHAGFLHIASNMWFLRIFGDNVEEKIGHFSFLSLYLFSGIMGGLLQYLFMRDATVPMLGASGAVAGVLGAYFVFFPRNKIETLVPLGFYTTILEVPSSFMLFYWFITQLFSGVGSIVESLAGGVAWWAHVGGFLSGWFLAELVKD